MSLPFPESGPAPAVSTHPSGWVLAHCDGGARGNPGPAGYGAVLTDEHGLVLAELSEFLGTRTNNVAEYAGLLAVLKWTVGHGYRRLRVVSDSLLMVNQMNGRFKVSSPDLKPLWTQARNLAQLLDAFEITHALRHKNKTADRLANQAMDRGTARGKGNEHSVALPAATPVNLAAASSEPRPQSAAGNLGTQSTPQATAAADHPASWRGVVRNGKIELLDKTGPPEGATLRITIG